MEGRKKRERINFFCTVASSAGVEEESGKFDKQAGEREGR